MSTVTSSTSTDFSSKLASSKAVTATTAQEASERFLKLLVTQLQNQDPLNPVDNAQMTSQMAQISTVSGIEKLNTTVEGLNSSFMQMQVMQGASLVGKDVLLKGDKLSVVDGQAQGTFEIDTAATAVKVEVLSPAGRLVETLNLPAQTAGRHDFHWANGASVQDAADHRFRVTAVSGKTELTATSLIRDHVDAVNTGGGKLTLELARSGRVAYANITAID